MESSLSDSQGGRAAVGLVPWGTRFVLQLLGVTLPSWEPLCPRLPVHTPLDTPLGFSPLGEKEEEKVCVGPEAGSQGDET